MKTLSFVLLASVLIFGSQYTGSTLSSVVLSGGIIKAQNSPVDHKYARKDCPICKGTGKYLSGDGIKMVDCGYCEPPKTQSVTQPQPAIKQVPQCTGTQCDIPKVYQTPPKIYYPKRVYRR